MKTQININLQFKLIYIFFFPFTVYNTINNYMFYYLK